VSNPKSEGGSTTECHFVTSLFGEPGFVGDQLEVVDHHDL